MEEVQQTVFSKAREATTYIEEQGVEKVEVGLILGSGLGELADEIENPIVIPYEEIPSFPVSTVEGHAGQLVYGMLGGKHVLALQGRFHYYEGYSMDEVTFPVRVMSMLGTDSIIVTNAAGGVNENFTPGDLMLITDHINSFGTNPLIGPNDDKFGPRFPDLTQAYDLDYQKLVKDVATDLNLSLQEGVYYGTTGPTYETPAEVRMIQTVGGDAVGMSTVPEVIVARHAGIRVVGISCISNLAAGMGEELNHEDVIAVTTKIRSSFKQLIVNVLQKI
ncbi:MAG TPA: purine-nucleoside phosphorylase [Atopostipes sp.]|jgi:purine-nucleoside phosphorylase|nr:purine-nucleoside phosphorylase [Atopostipes sp.]